MIDNPDKAAKLTKEMKASLPLTARLPPALKGMMLRQEPGAVLTDRCAVTEFFYMGDEGGIACRLDLGGPDTQNPFIVSITHLIFDRRRPVFRQIEAGTASKKLKKQHGRGY
jgi:hypothetical protein